MASLESKARYFLLFLTAAVALLGILLAGYSFNHWEKPQSDQMRSFQRTVGGLGMGAILTPSWNEMDFDPRLQPVIDSELWPVPSAYCFSPAQSATVTHFIEFVSIEPEPLLIIRPEKEKD